MPLETLLELAATSAFHRPSGAGLKVEPSKVALAVGAAQSFKVANEFATKVKWTTSNAAVLRPLRDGTFLATAAGSARACAVDGNQRSCAVVNVVP